MMTTEELTQAYKSLYENLKVDFDIRYIIIGIGKDRLAVYLQDDYMKKWEIDKISKCIRIWQELYQPRVEVDIRNIGKIVLAKEKP